MAQKNQQWNNRSGQYNNDWDQDFNHRNDDPGRDIYGSTGSNYNQQRNRGNYSNSGYSGSGNSYGNDEGFGNGNRGYGNRGNMNQQRNHGNQYGGWQGSGSNQFDDDNWQYRYNQDYASRNWDRRNMSAGNYDDNYDREDYTNRQNAGNYNKNRNYNEPRNMYGGDTSNYGNANQGGFDRDWWDRTKDKVSSWFGGDDSDDKDRDRRSYGGHRGKGPKDYQRSEERIREDVCDRLSDDDRLDATNIQVQIQGSEVILTGTVDSRDQKRRAEDLVESVSGVRNVENRIRVDHNHSNPHAI